MATSWWAEPAAQADRDTFAREVAAREHEMRLSREGQQTRWAPNIITASDEGGLRAARRARMGGDR